MKTNFHKGFTLIELLVVISIIGVLSTVILSSLASAKLKGYDARRKQDLRSILTAYALYNSSGNGPLTNFGCSGTCGLSDTDPRFLQGLINAGTIGSLPKAPDNDASNPYMFYDYGPGTAQGFLVVTQLESVPARTTAFPGSCRFNWGGPNWCDVNISSTYYCLCYPY